MIAGLKRALQVVQNLSTYYKRRSDLDNSTVYLDALQQVEKLILEELDTERRYPGLQE